MATLLHQRAAPRQRAPGLGAGRDPRAHQGGAGGPPDPLSRAHHCAQPPPGLLGDLHLPFVPITRPLLLGSAAALGAEASEENLEE